MNDYIAPWSWLDAVRPFLDVGRADAEWHEEDHPRGEGGQFVYHGTPRKNLASIRQHGLRPSEHGNPLNFHHDPDAARYYTEGRGALLRVPVDRLPSHQHDPLTHRRWTQSTVPAEHLEIKTRKGWSPLTSSSRHDDANWKESDHPRDQDGKFSEGGGGSFTADPMPTEKNLTAWVRHVEAEAKRLQDAGEDDPDNRHFNSIAHMATALENERSIKLSQKQFARFAAVEHEGKPAAAGWMTLSRDKKTAEITNVGSIVKGAGAEVMRSLISQARSAGAQRIELTSTAGLEYYERFGFRRLTGSKMVLDLTAKRAHRHDGAEWNESDHPRDAEGKFTSGDGTALKSEVHGSLPSGNKTMQTHGLKSRTAMQNIVKSSASVEEAAEKLKKYAAALSHSAHANYANDVLRVLEKAHDLKAGSLGQAQPKAKDGPPTATPKPSAKTASGPQPHPGSAVQTKIHSVATNAKLSDTAKVKIIQHIFAEHGVAGGYTEAFAKQWIAKLGGDPDSLKEKNLGPTTSTAFEPAPASEPPPSSSAKPGVSRGHEKVWTRWERLRASAKRVIGTNTETAENIAPTLRSKWWSKQPTAARSAVKDYTDGDYNTMNSTLRALAKGETKNVSSHAVKQINAIDELFEDDAARLTSDVVMWRGENVPDEELDKLEAQLKAGIPCRYHKTGFISTSMAGHAAFNHRNCIYEIVARKGTPALGIATISHHKNENEVLMRHGQVFEIAEIDRSGSPTRIKMYSIV